IYENPGFQSKTIGILKKNQTVTMLCMEPTGFAINGVEGSWMKIKTSYNLSGWVFSGYMKALKKAPVVQKHE
ncbi:MAG TPA: SH3 domain-containing protein, partial [Spirochaetota bacterium]|nr:SH3 domain-containing protein [Spirochaetota bacterium]